jgi:hypothetical protein
MTGTQPVTTYSTPTSNMTYYPTYYRGGLRGRFFRIFQPMNTTPTMAASPVYGTTPVTYTTMPTQTTYAPITQTSYTPAQPTYMPVRRGLFGLGLFQGRWRQQAYPMYTTAAPMTTGYYSTPGSVVPASYTAPMTYYYPAPAGAQPATTPATASAPAGTTPVTTTPTYTETQYTAPAGTAPASAAPASSLPSATAPSVTTPPAPPIPARVPRGTP